MPVNQRLNTLGQQVDTEVVDCGRKVSCLDCFTGDISQVLKIICCATFSL